MCRDAIGLRRPPHREGAALPPWTVARHVACAAFLLVTLHGALLGLLLFDAWARLHTPTVVAKDPFENAVWVGGALLPCTFAATVGWMRLFRVESVLWIVASGGLGAFAQIAVLALSPSYHDQAAWRGGFAFLVGALALGLFLGAEAGRRWNRRLRRERLRAEDAAVGEGSPTLAPAAPMTEPGGGSEAGWPRRSG